ncbi:tail assembly chaperone [Edwardsiella tarda]|uniref:tail fiber assembly protein n=1 Tax=Edwardsiella tarda TaxID=636 RepID=UPI00351CA410
MYKFYQNKFFPYALQPDYEKSLSWPDGGVDVDDEVFIKFKTPPEGKVRIVGADGYPAWGDIPPKTNEELLKNELQAISKKYQEDIDALNQAYLAAVVSDGPGEPAKQQAVRDAITARKAQYAADKEAARLKYPV